MGWPKKQIPISNSASMKVLSFDCQKRFETKGSISYKLTQPLGATQMPTDFLASVNRVVSVAGYVDLHYPVDGAVKAYIRIVLVERLAAKIDRSTIAKATEEFLREHSIPVDINYEVDLIPFKLIERVTKADLRSMQDIE
jgi:hypothetical protein